MLFALRNMKIEKIEELVGTVSGYLTKNGIEKSITAEVLTSDKTTLDEITDAVISLICKIGVDENFAPNIHGVILDGCLEALNQIREEYFGNE